MENLKSLLKLWQQHNNNDAKHNEKWTQKVRTSHAFIWFETSESSKPRLKKAQTQLQKSRK